MLLFKSLYLVTSIAFFTTYIPSAAASCFNLCKVPKSECVNGACSYPTKYSVTIKNTPSPPSSTTCWITDLPNEARGNCYALHVTIPVNRSPTYKLATNCPLKNARNVRIMCAPTVSNTTGWSCAGTVAKGIPSGQTITYPSSFSTCN